MRRIRGWQIGSVIGVRGWQFGTGLGRAGAAVFLEVCRDATDDAGNAGTPDTGIPAAAPHYVRAVDAMADRPAPPRVARASA